MKIIKIVLTGGPCAGKTEVSKYLKETLTKEGYNVIVVPETATELIEEGFIPTGTFSQIMNFQSMVLQLQRIKEKIIDEYLNNSPDEKDTIIIYDRGVLDNRAYFEYQEEFDHLLNLHELNEINLAYNYDLIIDLVSTSCSKNNLYMLDNIRYETKEQAKVLDKKTTEAWLLHPNIKIIKPTNTIEEKKENVLNIIKKYIDDKEIKEENINELDYENSDLSLYNYNNSKLINIEESYINTNNYIDNNFDNKDFILRKKTYNMGNIYELIVRKQEDNKIIEYKREVLTEKQYYQYLNLVKIEDVKNFMELKLLTNNYDIISLYKDKENFMIKTSKDANIPENLKIKENPKKTLLKK